MNTIGDLLKTSRKASGMSQMELSKRAQTSQPTLAAYENGHLMPRIDTVQKILKAAGFDLQIQSIPHVRRGSVPIAEVMNDVEGELNSDNGAAIWRALMDFIDDFRGSSSVGKHSLVTSQPPLFPDSRINAAIASVVEYECTNAHINIPAWCNDEDRFAKPWWFVAGLQGLEPLAIKDSPISFARHGVFITEGALDRV